MPETKSPEQTVVTAEPQLTHAHTADKPTENGFVSRESWLAQAGKLREAEHTVEGLGKLLLSELTGGARAAIQTNQSTGLLADLKRIDVSAYQRALLLQGVMDPSSPVGDRKPLFSAGDMDAVMKVGGAKIESVIDKLEELSGLGKSQASAEGNSPATPSSAGTSG